MPRHFAFLSLLFLTVLLLACGEPVATPEPVFLRATGSTAMSPLVAELATAFNKQSPTINLEVTGLGTQHGLDALQADEVDFALASWLLSDLSDWHTVTIARDGIAIIVHPSNPVTGVGLLQLQDLFSGRIYEWQAVGGRTTQGPVQLVSREKGSGTRAAFEALVMGDYQVTPLAVVAPSSQAVVEYVAGHHNAVGYVTMDYVSPEVKVVQIEGELPTLETVRQGSYPLTRELWLVATSPPSEAVQAFFDFVLSPSGQQIVGRRFGRVK